MYHTTSAFATRASDLVPIVLFHFSIFSTSYASLPPALVVSPKKYVSLTFSSAIAQVTSVPTKQTTLAPKLLASKSLCTFMS
ncbi:hypothetical protein DL96DRAFT_1579689 [Flagelloscypha sp. PMI_526]|nr:hypothetical protein DL96DRAFT_1579689 [Flagelloscypha sp. PMI_526]